MMSQDLRPIDANGHVPGPYGQAPAAITDPVAAEFERIARCGECGLVTLHSWDCRTGQAIRDVAKLLDAAEVFDRLWPELEDDANMGAVTRMLAERISRAVA